MPGEASRTRRILGAARHAIDMLAMIPEKTRGNLSIEEQRLIENSLTELRFRFVQVSEDKYAQVPRKRQPNRHTTRGASTANSRTEPRIRRNPGTKRARSDEPRKLGQTAE